MPQSPTPEELELSAGGLRLAARAWGPVDAAPVLALHGWLDNAASFDGLAPYFGECRLVALDLPGHGRSDHRPGGYWYPFVDFVADTLAAADALGWDRFALLGHSLGGAVAAFAAACRPERVTRVDLIEALGPLAERTDAALERLRGSVDRALAAPRRPAPTYPDLETATASRRAVGGLSDDAARCLAQRGTVASGEVLRWRTDPRLRRPSPYMWTEAQVCSVLAGVVQPTRVVCAEQGLLDPEEATLAGRLAAMPSATVARVAGHHHVHLDDPAAVAAVLTCTAG